MTVLAIIGFIIAWLLVVVGTYKGHNANYMCLFGALIIIVLSGVPVADGIITTYMGALASLCTTVFPLVVLGSILGRVYVDSGAASAIAFALFDRLMKNASVRARKILAILIIYVVGCVMCYGGVDSAALMFCLVPLSLVFFEYVDIPRKYAVGVCAHISVLCLCGWAAPTFYNIYPGLVLGTTPKAGTALGVTALVLNLVIGNILANIYIMRDEKKGIGFEWGNAQKPDYDKENMPHPVIALMPLVVAMVMFIGFNVHFTASCSVGVVLALILFAKNIKVDQGSNLNKAYAKMLTQGTASGVNGAIVLCSMSAFGAVVQANPVFSAVSGGILNMNIASVVMYAILVAVLGLLTGASISGFQAGLGLAMEHTKFGLSDAVLHRIGAQTAATVNLAPFTGVIFVTLGLAGLSHKEGYTTVLKLPVLTMAIVTVITVILAIALPGIA